MARRRPAIPRVFRTRRALVGYNRDDVKVSIVTPTYNGAAYLGETIESVVRQTEPGWELVVVDDGSDDDSPAIAARYASIDPRIQTLARSRTGVAAARNEGLGRTDPAADYVLFLDHDDVLLPDTLATLIAAAETDPAAVGAHGLAREVDASGAPTGVVLNAERRKVAGSRIAFCAPGEPTTFATLLCDCCLPTPGVALIRRSAIDTALADGPLFDTAVGTANDWYAWLRLTLHGDFVFQNRVVLEWRRHDANDSHHREKMFDAEAAMRLKAVDLARTPDQRRMALWRCRRSFASIERRHASDCAASMRERLRAGDSSGASDAARLCGRHWGRYVALRLGRGPIELPCYRPDTVPAAPISHPSV